MTTRRVSPAAVAATIAAALAVIAGLSILGTPTHARERRLDEMRVQDLSMLSQQLDGYWVKHAALPDSLDSLVTTHQIDRVPHDPATGARYSYVASSARSYRLCATFQQPSDTTESYPQVTAAGGRVPRSWRHGAGESCFDLAPPPKEAK